jgi:hypothetical protein
MWPPPYKNLNFILEGKGLIDLALMSALEPLSRNAQGQYQVTVDTTNRDSAIRHVVHEEVEAFVTNLKRKLNALAPSDMNDDEETTDLRDDIVSVLAEHLGVKVAKAVVSYVKKPSPWNNFCRARYHIKSAELDVLEDTPQGMSMFHE